MSEENSKIQEGNNSKTNEKLEDGEEEK